MKGSDRAARSLRLIVYIVLIICLLIGQEPKVNFRNKHNLQVAHAAHDFQKQWYNVFCEEI